MKLDAFDIVVGLFFIALFGYLFIEPMVRRRKDKKTESEMKALREKNQPTTEQSYFFENEPDLEVVVTEINKDEGYVSGDLVFHLPVGAEVSHFDQTKLRKIQVYYSLNLDQTSIDYCGLFNATDDIKGLGGWDVWYNIPYIIKKDRTVKTR